VRDETVLPVDDQAALDALQALLKGHTSEDLALLSDADGHRASVPAALTAILADVVDAMLHGQAVTIVPSSQRLTTQEAADLLGISRPTLIKLLETGEIPFETPGRHRRIRLVDLLAYQSDRRTDRRDTLRQLTQDAQDLGLLDEPGDIYDVALGEARKKLA
jgi:excisionase family DNA binding protein